VGDALGAPIEFMRIGQIRARFGAAGLTELSPAYGKLGALTDDTQMTLFTAEGLLRAEVAGERPDLRALTTSVHAAYLRWLATQGVRTRGLAEKSDGWLSGHEALWSQRAPGNTCLGALSAEVPLGAPAANDSKGCGTVMRVAPVGLVYPSAQRGAAVNAFDLGCAVSRLTHGHATGYLAGGYFAELIALLGEGIPLRTAAEAALSPLPAAGREVASAVRAALQQAEAGVPAAAEDVERLGGGWVAEEAVAIALYCALVASDFSAGVCLAANISGDSDSTASMAGQLLGFVHGSGAIPERWLAPLELRDVLALVADDLHALASGRALPDPLRARYG
jgi:ADP-ribosyl-[dinitrogen reductase] hydrolase